jgi:hypothetical protein
MRRAVLVLVAVVPAAGSVRAGKVSELLPQRRKWVEEEVYPLITAEQRETFRPRERCRASGLRGASVDPLGRTVRAGHLLPAQLPGPTRAVQKRVRQRDGGQGARPLDSGSARSEKGHRLRQDLSTPGVLAVGATRRVGQNVVIVLYKPYGLGR